MFPEIIAFDEIGTEDELLSRNITRRLITDGIITKIALLPTLHGNEIKLFSAKELLHRVAV